MIDEVPDERLRHHYRQQPVTLTPETHHRVREALICRQIENVEHVVGGERPDQLLLTLDNGVTVVLEGSPLDLRVSQ